MILNGCVVPKDCMPMDEILGAMFSEPPGFSRRVARKGSKGAGLAFERKVHKMLGKEFRGKYLESPWIEYYEAGRGKKYCQPDGVIFDPWLGKILVVECKLSFTSNAYFQMAHKYVPLLKAMYPGWKVSGVQVCKNYGFGETYPVEPEMGVSVDLGMGGLANVAVVRSF